MLEDFAIIKLFEYPNYKFSVKLGQKYYTLEFIENVVNNSVCLNLYDNGLNPILLGIKVSAALNLLSGITISNMPEGTLLLMTPDLSRDLIVGDDLQGVFLLYSENKYEDIFEALQNVSV